MDSTMVYNISVILGMFFIIYAALEKPNLLKADKHFVKKWMLIIFITMLTANCAAGLSGAHSPWFIEEVWGRGINSLIGVVWEEGLFVLPFLILYQRFPGRKFLWFLPFMIASSLYFAIGHSYQGEHWPWFALVPFLSLWLCVKKGAGTSMILRVFYDVCVVSSNYIILKLFNSL